MTSEAPERIIARMDYNGTDDGFWVDAGIPLPPPYDMREHVEYLRADLAPQWRPIRSYSKALDKHGIGRTVRLFFPDYVAGDKMTGQAAPGQREGYWAGSEEHGRWVTPGTMSTLDPKPTHFMPLPGAPNEP